ADFARAVMDAGLTWIGPPPEAIEKLGDKVSARHIAQKAGAPLVAGTKDPVASSDRKSTRLNSSHVSISYAVFCLKKKITNAQASTRVQIFLPAKTPYLTDERSNTLQSSTSLIAPTTKTRLTALQSAITASRYIDQ